MIQLREKSIYVAKNIFLCILYILLAKVGLSINAVNKFAAPLWLPSGVMIATLLYDVSLWPGVALGAFLINFFTGAPFPVAVSIGLGNTLEAITAIYLLRRYQFNQSIERQKDVLLLLLVAIICPIISATLGVGSLILFHVLHSRSFFITFLPWFIGDAISIIIITPLLLTFSHIQQQKKKRNDYWWSRTIYESIIALVILTMIMVILSQLKLSSGQLRFLVFPPLIWIALRLGQPTTSIASFIITIFVTFATLHGFGPFKGNDIYSRLLMLDLFIAVITITALILAVEEIEKKNYEKRKDEFISLASHELKTPLTVIRLLVHIVEKRMQHTNGQKETSEFKRIDNEITKLTNLINGLLSISKMQSGQLDIHEEYFDLQELLEELISSFQLTVSSHAIIFKHKSYKKGCMTFADKDKIAQVISNLIANAIKYSPGKKKVYVKLEKKGSRLYVHVIDSGIGIAKKYHDKIFNLYFRIEGSHSQGMGAGLYIANEILRRHNTTLNIDSIEGKGSRFFFSLPFAQHKEDI